MKGWESCKAFAQWETGARGAAGVFHINPVVFYDFKKIVASGPWLAYLQGCRTVKGVNERHCLNSLFTLGIAIQTEDYARP